LSTSLLDGFAVCPSGLEETLAAELRGFTGFHDIQTGRGGVRFRAEATAIARANIWARIPTRILVRVVQFTIRAPKDILLNTAQLPWEEWFTHRETFRIDYAVGRAPTLDQPLARNYAALLIKDGICDRFREKTTERPSVDTENADIRIWAYLDQNRLTLYIDTSGEPLFKRGWRSEKGEAPLRENLAAALIAMTEWDGQAMLLDPFCGSGTFLIEAMQKVMQIPPGFNAFHPRSFSAEKLRKTSPMGQVNWSGLRAEAQRAIDQAVQRLAEKPPPKMMGTDQDSRLIRFAQENAARALPAKIAQHIVWRVTALADLEPPAAAGLWLANPPYGKRLEQNGEAFERDMAETLKKKFSGWQAWILTDNLKLESGMRLKSSRRVPVFNGDIECRWMRFDMVEGSMRAPTIPNQIKQVQKRITKACAEHQIAVEQVRLIAVSKTYPPERIRQAFEAGLKEFGENYVQEGIDKIQALSDLREALTWHYIGPLQSNKTREVAEHFDWMHTLDRERIAQRLSLQRPADRPPLQVCIQVNISDEPTKSGLTADAVAGLAQAVVQLPGLCLRGLMAIPEASDDPDQQRQAFHALADLHAQTKALLPAPAQAAFNVLSMGMSADLEAAIAESRPEVQTLIRVGTAIFGART